MKARTASKNGGRTPPDVSCCKVTGQSNVLYSKHRSHLLPYRRHLLPPHEKVVCGRNFRCLFADRLIL